MYKLCTKCDTLKPLSKYRIRKSGPRTGKPFSHCRECERLNHKAYRLTHKDQRKAYHKVYQKEYQKKHPNHTINWMHKTGKSKPMSENKACASYLGYVISETILSREFPGIIRMPQNHPGYDFYCPKGFTIDVKSSCLISREHGNDFWSFDINYNQIPDYFLLLFWDNRTDLNPLHIMLIPGPVINNKSTLSITNSPKSLSKWSKYSRPLTNALNCCSQLRGLTSPNPFLRYLDVIANPFKLTTESLFKPLA